MSPARVPYSFALLRVVPHPHTGAGVNIGVLVHARTAEYLGLKVVSDADRLRALAPDVDVELLTRYLHSCELIAAGDEAGGEIALLSMPERFRWLAAPRSDVLQPSAVHDGLTDDPARELEALFASCVDLESRGSR